MTWSFQLGILLQHRKPSVYTEFSTLLMIYECGHHLRRPGNLFQCVSSRSASLRLWLWSCMWLVVDPGSVRSSLRGDRRLSCYSLWEYMTWSFQLGILLQHRKPSVYTEFSTLLMIYECGHHLRRPGNLFQCVSSRKASLRLWLWSCTWLELELGLWIATSCWHRSCQDNHTLWLCRILYCTRPDRPSYFPMNSVPSRLAWLAW